MQSPANRRHSTDFERAGRFAGVMKAFSGSTPLEYGLGVLVAAAATVVSHSIAPWAQLADLVIVHLVGAVAMAARFSVGPSLLTAVLCILSFDYFYIPPLLQFAWPDGKSALTFFGMLIVAGVVSGLSQGLRREREAARRSEARTIALQALNQELSSLHSLQQLVACAIRHLERLFEARAVIALRAGDGELAIDTLRLGSPEEEQRARRAWESCELVHEPHASGYSVWCSLVGSHRNVGVIGLEPLSPGKFADPEVQRLLLLCAAQLASAIERVLLSAAAHGAELAAETERARGSLLAAVSHDLKTPLASILFAASTLDRAPPELPAERRRELIGTVIEETERLGRLVANVLSMTKLESGGLAVRRQIEDVSELVDGALRVLAPRLEGRPVTVELERALPFVDVDALLIQQVLVNLLENALRYTPAHSPLKIIATAGEHGVAICVQDEGPGIAVEEREKIFEKFFRGSQSSRSDGGVGLGLAICRAAIQAHGGRIYVKHGGNKGARVEFTLPIKRVDSIVDGHA